MMTFLVDQFDHGTTDTEWFCAAKAMVDTLFDLNTIDCHEYAKVFIESMIRKMYIPPSDPDPDPMDNQINSSSQAMS